MGEMQLAFFVLVALAAGGAAIAVAQCAPEQVKVPVLAGIFIVASACALAVAAGLPYTSSSSDGFAAIRAAMAHATPVAP